MTAANASFVGESAHYLRDVYLPRLERAFEVLPEGDLWWRPHAGAITFGTILLHLAGNVRQWILSGLGGQPDHRDRHSEFSATSGPDGRVLLSRLRDTVDAACDVIEALDETRLCEAAVIQGFETTVRGAVYHVVEHFSWHSGQAVWIAKSRAGAEHGVAFYDDAKVNAARNE